MKLLLCCYYFCLGLFFILHCFSDVRNCCVLSECEQCEHIVVDFCIIFRTMSRVSNIDLPNRFEKCSVWFKFQWVWKFEIFTNFRLHQFFITTMCAIRNEMWTKILLRSPFTHDKVRKTKANGKIDIRTYIPKCNFSGALNIQHLMNENEDCPF